MSSPSLAIKDAELAAWAAVIGEQGPVTVTGGRTHWDVGGRPDAEAAEVEAPVGVVSVEPAEMVVTVRAGTTVAALHQALEGHNQRTALAERPGSTVGGSLMVGHNSMHALARGSIRQALLMARYVTAQGALSTAGGPTVKNVSGFDLPRLLVGSLGTLGFVGEVMLRTQPIPERSQWMTVTGLGPRSVHDMAVGASAILWNGTSAWVHCEGHHADVEEVGNELASKARVEAVSGPPSMGSERTSLAPAQALTHASGDQWVEVGTGVVHHHGAVPPLPVSPAVAALNQRVRQAFDPTRRCNPGRQPW